MSKCPLMAWRGLLTPEGTGLLPEPSDKFQLMPAEARNAAIDGLVAILRFS
jgi:hypothetical protein